MGSMLSILLKRQQFMHKKPPFTPLNIAILTVSDTRTEANDVSGKTLKANAEMAGHHVVDQTIIKDDVFHLRAVVSDWIHRSEVQVVLITGGTGFSERDGTPEAIAPLLVQPIPGFGELFRQVSYQEVGSSTIQSRAFAGLSNGTLIAAMPGSTNACRTAWEHILKEQLDASHRPCNFATHVLKKSAENKHRNFGSTPGSSQGG